MKLVATLTTALLLLPLITYANGLSPAWTITCYEAHENKIAVEIGLFRTGHPMGGIFSYSGLISHNHLVFLANFVQVNPPLLKGSANDLSSTEYEIELAWEHLNSEAQLPARMELNERDPLGEVSIKEIPLICHGHR